MQYANEDAIFDDQNNKYGATKLHFSEHTLAIRPWSLQF